MKRLTKIQQAGNSDFKKPEDEVRRRVLIPMIRAEMKRREKLAQAEKHFERIEEDYYDARANTR